MLKSSQIMAMLWKLGQTNIVKQFYHRVTVLSCRNPLLPNIIPRLGSAIRKMSLSQVKSRIERKFQIIDKVSDDFRMIYRNPSTNLITWSYYGSYCCIVTMLITLFYLRKNMDNSTSADMEIPSLLEVNDRSEKLQSLYCLGAAMFMNIILLIVCRLHVSRIWYNEKTNEYMLCLIGNIPGLRKNVVFGPGAAKLKIKNPKIAIARMAHLINGKTYFFNSEQFKTPRDYTRLIGAT